MSNSENISSFDDLKIFAEVVNIKDITLPALAVRVKDILNKSKNNGGGYCSVKQAIIIAKMVRNLKK